MFATTIEFTARPSLGELDEKTAVTDAGSIDVGEVPRHLAVLHTASKRGRTQLGAYYFRRPIAGFLRGVVEF